MGKVIIIIIFITVIYMLYLYYRHQEDSNHRENEINLKKINYDAAQKSTQKSLNDVLHTVASTYGQEDAERVKDGKIWIGMPTTLLLISIGAPEEEKENYIRGICIEKWYYKPYYNRLNNVKYKLEITIEDNLVTGWKDLN